MLDLSIDRLATDNGSISSEIMSFTPVNGKIDLGTPSRESLVFSNGSRGDVSHRSQLL